MYRPLFALAAAGLIAVSGCGVLQTGQQNEPYPDDPGTYRDTGYGQVSQTAIRACKTEIVGRWRMPESRVHTSGRSTNPDGESLVRVRVAADEVIVVRSLHDPDAKLVPLLLAADALRRAGARRAILVAPYLPYMRQDRVFRRGEPLSQRVVGRLLGEAFDRVLTVEAHLHRTRRLGDVVTCPARSVSAAPLLARWCLAHPAVQLVVGPDEESEPREDEDSDEESLLDPESYSVIVTPR